MFVLLLTNICVLALNIRPVDAIGTIYIKADGSIDPQDAPILTIDNVTYILTGNITSVADGIIVERDNVIIDGNQYTIQGPGTSDGIDLTGRSNVAVKNTAVWNFGTSINLSGTDRATISGNTLTNNQFGIYFESSSNSNISGNKITNGEFGIYFDASSNNSIDGNNIINDNDKGVTLYSSSNNSINGNNIANDTNGIYFDASSNNSINGNNITANSESGIYFGSSSNNSISGNSFVNDGLYVSNSFGNVVSANFANGKPLVYLEDTSDIVVSDAGQVVLVQCNRIRVENLNLPDATVDVELWQTNNTEISENNIASSWYGIFLYSSFGDSISGNNITAIGDYGIGAYSCIGNNISGNTVTNGFFGIYFEASSNNSIDGNNMTNNQFGIYFESSSNSNISGNTMTNNWAGIDLESSSNNTVSGNTIARAHQYGLYLYVSSDNKFYHNNFINNANQVELFSSSPNVWDDGYPSGGNHWSDYSGADSYSGPFQNETGSDGRWDKPYVIDANNTDHYPLVNPWSTLPDIAVTLVSTAKTVIGQGYTGSVNVTLENLSNSVEAFNLTVYANSTIIHSEEINLAPTNHTVSFKWNTTGFAYGNYTITAYAWPVTNETNTANNNFTCAIPVHVGVPADISGSTVGAYNRVCDMKDIAFLIVHFTGKPGNSKWDPNADVNDDNVINMRDIAIAVHYFNQRE